jgi:hypothetical protein
MAAWSDSSGALAWLSLFVDDGRTFPIPRKRTDETRLVGASYGHAQLLASVISLEAADRRDSARALGLNRPGYRAALDSAG